MAPTEFNDGRPARTQLEKKKTSFLLRGIAVRYVRTYVYAVSYLARPPEMELKHEINSSKESNVPDIGRFFYRLAIFVELTAQILVARVKN